MSEEQTSHDMVVSSESGNGWVVVTCTGCPFKAVRRPTEVGEAFNAHLSEVPKPTRRSSADQTASLRRSGREDRAASRPGPAPQPERVLPWIRYIDSAHEGLSEAELQQVLSVVQLVAQSVPGASKLTPHRAKQQLLAERDLRLDSYRRVLAAVILSIPHTDYHNVAPILRVSTTWLRVWAFGADYLFKSNPLAREFAQMVAGRSGVQLDLSIYESGDSDQGNARADKG
jgi:hypothetical protein